jgi:hypothetical protein
VWAGIAAEVGVLLLIVYVPFLQSIFGTAGIPAQGWGFLLLCVPALLLADEVLAVVHATQAGKLAALLGPRKG